MAHTSATPGKVWIVAVLGTAQTLAWASSYYLVAILADPIALDLAVSANWIFAAFSASLLIAGLLGPAVGRTIDRHGGRMVLAGSSLLFASGHVTLALSGNIAVNALGWLLLGAGMGLGLYDAAFAALGRIWGHAARPSITGITLLAGFASTVGWPLTSWGTEVIGWRNTCLCWAAAHICIGLPLNLLLPRVHGSAQAAPPRAVTPPLAAGDRIAFDRVMILLSYAFAAGWIVSSAMAAHLPRILEAAGATTAQAIAAGALIGPAQVAARMLEASLMRHVHPISSAIASTVAHPIGVAGLALTGGVWPSFFVLLHGAGNGILTIARGTVPLALYGPHRYGERLGLIGAPSRIAQAFAPLAFGFLLDRLGSNVLLVSSALSLSALLALLMVRSTALPTPAQNAADE